MYHERDHLLALSICRNIILEKKIVDFHVHNVDQLDYIDRLFVSRTKVRLNHLIASFEQRNDKLQRIAKKKI